MLLHHFWPEPCLKDETESDELIINLLNFVTLLKLTHWPSDSLTISSPSKNGNVGDIVENLEIWVMTIIMCWVIIIMEPLFFSVCPAGKCTGRRSIFCQNMLMMKMMMMTVIFNDDDKKTQISWRCRLSLKAKDSKELHITYQHIRSLGALRRRLRAPTFSWRPFVQRIF